MGAAILKLDRDRKFMNADITWAYPVDLNYVEPVQKHVNKCEQRIIPELNDIILLKLCHEWYTTILVWARRNLTREDDSKWLSIETVFRVTLENVHVTSGHFSLLLPAFESGFRCSCNGCTPVIWIISLYLWYQVYFVIIIVEFLLLFQGFHIYNIFSEGAVPL